MGDLLVWQNETLAKIAVRDQYEEDFGKIEARSFDEMERVRPEMVSKLATTGSEIFHEYVIRWIAVPPKLPAGAQRIRTEGNIEIFKLGQQMFVAVKRKDQLLEAKKIAENEPVKIVFDDR